MTSSIFCIPGYKCFNYVDKPYRSLLDRVKHNKIENAHNAILITKNMSKDKFLLSKLIKKIPEHSIRCNDSGNVYVLID